MIPRLLHRVWLGDAPMPEQYEGFWRAWQAMNPGWELRTHGASAVSNRTLFDSLTTLSAKSDLLRYELMAAHGGVYVDTDMEPLRPLDELLANLPGVRAFAAWEDEKRACTAMMGAEAGHPAVRALVKALPAWSRSHRNATPDIQTGPVFLTQTWRGRADVTLLPPATFYPVGYWQRTVLQTPGYRDGLVPGAYALHHWGRSWMPEDKRRIDDAIVAPAPVLEGVAILVPRLPDGGHRDAVWAWLKQRWEENFPEVEIIEGVSDPFHRAAALNAAAAQAPADVGTFIVIDADVWCNPRAVRASLAAAVDYHLPWNTCYKLGRAATDRLLAQSPLDVQLTHEFAKRHAETTANHSSGVLVVRRAAFEAVGGYDEGFRGWGAEDTAFVYALDAAAGRSTFNPRGKAPLIHLWHRPAPDAGKTSRASLALEAEYRARRAAKP